jgi:hypothetical protein
MIKPPRDLRGTRIFEVDDGIFIAIEMGFIEERSGAMQQAGKLEFHVASDALAIEAREERRRRCSVETLIVVENFDFQSIPQLYKFPPSSFATSWHNQVRSKS